MIDFEQEIALAIKEQKTTQIKAGELLNGRGGKCFIVGRNDQSYEFATRYHVDGLIDDFSHGHKSWNNIPVLKTSDVPKDAVIVNCTTSISPSLVSRKLDHAGFTKVLEVSSLISEGGEVLSLPWFVSQQRVEMEQNKSWYKSLYAMFADETSRETFLDVLRFRLTAKNKYLSTYRVRPNEQYFEEFMEYRDEVFVDAGGYDGDTTQEFINRYPNYKRVYFFEPSIRNLSAAQERLLGRRDIVFKGVGLSDVSGTLNFCPNAGPASAINNSGEESIKVVALDQELSSASISFIKMDLEGWEMNALRGAEQIIRANRPKLAIAVYHTAKDFREIPHFILSLGLRYKIYLRHYTQGWSETVMYFA